jgi:hypothetical protein
MPLLHDRDIQALSLTSRALRESTSLERAARQAARSLINTPVGSGHQLRQRLGVRTGAGHEGPTVQALPIHLRAEPLVALGSHLLQMPETDRAQAIQDFLAFPVPEGAHPVLADLRRAAQDGEAGLTARDDRLTATGGAAREAVRNGENILAVSRGLGIGGDRALGMLQTVALPRAHEALDRGETVSAVARRLGITHLTGLLSLQVRAEANLPELEVMHAVQDGRRVEHFGGAADRTTLYNLNHHIALQAARHGENIGQAARRFGIEAGDAAWSLEPQSASMALVQARLARRPDLVRRVADVVQERGIRQPILITQLERQAVDLRGPALLQRGLTPEAVAEQLGVGMPEHLALLRRMAVDLHRA